MADVVVQRREVMTIWQAMNMFETLIGNESRHFVIDRRIKNYMYRVIRQNRENKYEGDKDRSDRTLAKNVSKR